MARAARVAESASGATPGTVIGGSASSLLIATGDGDLAITDLATANGVPLVLTAGDLEALSNQPLEAPPDELLTRITRLNKRACRAEESWVDRLEQAEPLQLPDW